MGKFFILNADDFGMSKEYNKAVLAGYNNGFLTSASLCANGEAFSAAVNDILPDCPDLGRGVHLNIIEGKSLTKCDLLTDKNSVFNKGYLYFILNSKNKKVLSQIEQEFRAQIELIKQYTEIDHIDSHVHTHAIPDIFELVCNLAKEYNIPYVRTQHEKMYFVPKKYLSINYFINIIKILLLNHFTEINKKTLKKYGLKTNDYILGVGYTGMMDTETISSGLAEITGNNIVEALIHPCCYDKNIKNSHSTEFQITLDKRLEDKIKRMGYEIINYKKQVG